MLKKRERRTAVNGKAYPTYSLEQVIHYVISAKKSEGLRERTLIDYAKHWGYFVKWLKGFYEINQKRSLRASLIASPNHLSI